MPMDAKLPPRAPLEWTPIGGAAFLMEAAGFETTGCGAGARRWAKAPEETRIASPTAVNTFITPHIMPPRHPVYNGLRRSGALVNNAPAMTSRASHYYFLIGAGVRV